MGGTRARGGRGRARGAPARRVGVHGRARGRNPGEQRTPAVAARGDAGGRELRPSFSRPRFVLGADDGREADLHRPPHGRERRRHPCLHRVRGDLPPGPRPPQHCPVPRRGARRGGGHHLHLPRVRRRRQYPSPPLALRVLQREAHAALRAPRHCGRGLPPQPPHRPSRHQGRQRARGSVGCVQARRLWRVQEDCRHAGRQSRLSVTQGHALLDGAGGDQADWPRARSGRVEPRVHLD
mmetsp:Transcript_2221/g.6705  ORF Transcript_2221/g.6705 Transcript_2221/m.6705 type:complete len:238 (+) Transcript_2221:224-937(+)